MGERGITDEKLWNILEDLLNIGWHYGKWMSEAFRYELQGRQNNWDMENISW